MTAPARSTSTALAICLDLATALSLALLPGAAAAQDRAGQEQETAGEPGTTLKVMTWNVLADEVEPILRMRALLAIMREEDPDIIALQEAAPWIVERLLRNAWIRTHFKGSDFGPRNPAPGGQYILSKLPIVQGSTGLLPGDQQRTVVSISIEIDGGELQVATTHLESPLDAGPVRAEQLDAVFTHVEQATEAIVLGDFNFGNGDADEAHVDDRYIDAWRHLHPDDPGYTWDIDKNPLARAGSLDGESSRRLDRILIRAPRWRAAEVRIVGDEAIKDDGTLFPSDHFGLVAVLRRAGERDR